MFQPVFRLAMRHKIPQKICGCSRTQSTTVQPDATKNDTSSELNRSPSQTPSDNINTSAKPFKQIPGPLSLPLVGTLYLYLIRKYKFSRLHHNGLKKFKKYGPIVKEEILPGVPIVWVFDPNDMETLFRSETGYPERRSHLAIEKFRKDRPHVYNTGGLLPTNGSEWWRIRKEFQKGLSAPRCVRAYLPATDDVIREFVSSRLIRPQNDFLPELSRLFLELTCLVAFDVKLGSFTAKEMKPESTSSRLMEAALTTNSTILDLDNRSQRWKQKETALYKKFQDAMLFMEKIAVQLVEEKAGALANMEQIEDEEYVPSLLELYLSSPVLDSKDVVGMAVDMLLAGIDTTTYTASFALYHLAKNPAAQELLRREANRLLGPPGSNAKPITAETLAHTPYARAVLKEVFRMNPVSVGVGRITTQDIVLSGYQIPAGTVVVTQNQVSCRLEEYFKKPDFFIPERWIKGHEMQMNGNPYLVLPFGHGARSCIARRLAEQHLLTLLLRTVHEHRIFWTGKRILDCESLLINKPDKPVALQFSPIS